MSALVDREEFYVADITAKAGERARELQWRYGGVISLRTKDALHIAMAELLNCTFLDTWDEKIIEVVAAENNGLRAVHYGECVPDVPEAVGGGADKAAMASSTTAKRGRRPEAAGQHDLFLASAANATNTASSETPPSAEPRVAAASTIVERATLQLVRDAVPRSKKSSRSSRRTRMVPPSADP